MYRSSLTLQIGKLRFRPAMVMVWDNISFSPPFVWDCMSGLFGPFYMLFYRADLAMSIANQRV